MRKLAEETSDGHSFRLGKRMKGTRFRGVRAYCAQAHADVLRFGGGFLFMNTDRRQYEL